MPCCHPHISQDCGWAPILILETWLSIITWYMLQDCTWPREPGGWTAVRKPSSKQAHLTMHWFNIAWQSENLSSTLRMGSEETHSYSLVTHWRRFYLFQLASPGMLRASGSIRKLRTEPLPCWKMSSFFFMKFGILCITLKLGHSMKFSES